jgi:hypothetical protein
MGTFFSMAVLVVTGTERIAGFSDVSLEQPDKKIKTIKTHFICLTFPPFAGVFPEGHACVPHAGGLMA